MNQQMTFLNSSDIAVYIPGNDKAKQRKQGWSGLRMLCTEINRAGYEIDYCDKETVNLHKVILVSLISALDWFDFIAERVQWPAGNYKVIIGGAGVDNVRPFLEYADIFVFGRAENIIAPLIQATLENQRFFDPSVCYPDTFSLDKYYEISQAETCYPYPVTLTTGNKWTETAIGCERKCLFCNYSWTRKHRGNNQSDSGSAKTIWGASIESTIFQLDLDNPESWPRAGYMIFGIDGMSERLRRMVNKPITNKMLQRFLQGIPARYGNGKSHIIKWYNIIGYPTETDNDWQEMRDLMYRSSSPRVVKDSKIAKIHMHHTPYKSAPCTPTATWPVMYTNHRSILVERLQHENCQQYRYGLYAGTTVDFNATYATESLPTTAKWMIAFRGLESDTDFVRNLATSAFFNRSKTAEKIKWLEHNIDIFRFFDTYTWDTLPTRYLHTHTSDKKMALASDTLLCRYGGIEGIKLADKIAGR